jgi:antitoxin StbD
MENIFANVSVSVTEFKKNPSALLNSIKEPIAILSHNKPIAYLLPPNIYENMINRIKDLEV